MSDLTPERWQRLRPLLEEILDLDPSARRRRLEELTALASDLRSDLEDLLIAYEDAPVLFEGPFGESAVDQHADATLAEDLRLGSRIGGYHLVERLGQGGMGAVYLAQREDAPFDHRVAIKLLRPGVTSEAIEWRFVEEQRILAALNHPNIARLYDGGLSDDGQPYIVMELVDGTPLDRYCDATGLDADQRLDLFDTVCAAVEYAHAKLVVHRDLKPSNILVTAEGTVKLLDFGVAKLLATGDERAQDPRTLTALYGTPMTPDFAAPEQFTGAPVTTATDVYSLGVVLYELLTGERPLSLVSLPIHAMAKTVLETDPERPSSVLRRRLRRDRSPTGEEAGGPEERWPERAALVRRMRRLEGDLDTILLTALARDPADRYPTVGALREDLERHRQHLPIRARPLSWRYLVGRFVRRHRVAVGVATVVLLSLVVGLALAIAGQRAAQREAATSERIAGFLVDLFRTPDPTYGRDGSMTAADLLDEAAERIKTELIEEPEIRARLMQVIGESYQGVGLFDRAETLVEESVVLWQELRAPSDNDLISARILLAELYRLTGRLDEAEAVYRELLLVAEGRRANEDLVATISSDLGMLLRERGEAEEAEALQRRAVSIRRRLGIERTQEGARTLNNLAMTLLAQERLEEAEATLRQVLEIQREVLEEPHVDFARTLNNLAAARRQQGDLAAAEALYREALAQRRTVLGESHPDVAQSLNNVGTLLFYRGDLAGAAEHFERAHAIWRQFFVTDHPRLADVLSNLGTIRSRQGRYAEAESHLREAAEMQERLYGEEHPRLGLALYRLGSLRLAAGDPRGARSALERALSIQEAALGSEHPRTAATSIALARALAGSGEERAAEALLERTAAAVEGREELEAEVREARQELADRGTD